MAVGLIVSYWLPWVWVTVGVGALLGGVIGARLRRRESAHLLALIDLDLRVGETALVTVVAEAHLDEVRHAMWRARKTTGRVLDDPESLRLARGLVRGDPVATEALGGTG